MNYFLWIDGQEQGPYTLEQIRIAVSDGTIKASQTARTESSAQWGPLDTLANLTPKKATKNSSTKAYKTDNSPSVSSQVDSFTPVRSRLSLTYTNFLLTVIAACLLIQVRSALFPKAVEAKILNTVETRVLNTVETKVISPVFNGAGTNYRDGLGVVILNK